jgi:hypothetical protein
MNPGTDMFVVRRFIAVDGAVQKVENYPWFVIPAKAGIQENQHVIDSRFRGNDTKITLLGYPRGGFGSALPSKLR